MAEQELPLKDIYCTKCEEVTPHAGSVDDNGEFVFHCTAKTVPDPKDETKEVFHHFLKFPADTTPEHFEALVDIHQFHNEGQVPVAAQQARLKALLGVSLQNAEPSTPPDSTPPVEGEENTATDNQPTS